MDQAQTKLGSSHGYRIMPSLVLDHPIMQKMHEFFVDRDYRLHPVRSTMMKPAMDRVKAIDRARNG